MLSFHINTFFIVNEMCLPISVQDILISLCLFLILLDTFLLSILLYYTPFMVNNKGKVWRNGKKVVSLHEKLQV